MRTRVYNKEYNVDLVIDLYEESVSIPGQEILGKVHGYLKKRTDSRVWAVMSAEISKNGREATLEIVNDYGSEELFAKLTFKPDGTYQLEHLKGSTMRVAGKGKWIKLPKTMIFAK